MMQGSIRRIEFSIKDCLTDTSNLTIRRRQIAESKRGPGTKVEDFSIRIYQPGDEPAVIRLWQACGLVVPWNNPGSDIARKCADSPDLFFIGEQAHEIIATCMAGYDGHRGWIYFLAVKESQQRKGLASRLVAHVESILLDRGCPKLELMVRNTNDRVISFYRSIGYDLDPVIVLSKRLSEDEKHDFS